MSGGPAFRGRTRALNSFNEISHGTWLAAETGLPGTTLPTVEAEEHRTLRRPSGPRLPLGCHGKRFHSVTAARARGPAAIQIFFSLYFQRARVGVCVRPVSPRSVLGPPEEAMDYSSLP